MEESQQEAQPTIGEYQGKPIIRIPTVDNPNPFNPSTTISFTVPEKSFVSLKVFSVLGKEITELAGKEYAAGQHLVSFDGSSLASGVYFYTVRSGKFTSTQKMMFQK